MGIRMYGEQLHTESSAYVSPLDKGWGGNIGVRHHGCVLKEVKDTLTTSSVSVTFPAPPPIGPDRTALCRYRKYFHCAYFAVEAVYEVPLKLSYNSATWKTH